MLCFHLWQPVYFNEDDSSFPNDTTEIRGKFADINENFGHDMIFKILNTSTNKTISRSAVRPADGNTSHNLRADPLTSPDTIKSLHDDSIANTEDTVSKDSESPSSSKWYMHILDPIDLVGRAFLLNKDDGQRLRARIVKALDEYYVDLARDSSRIIFFAA